MRRVAHAVVSLLRGGLLFVLLGMVRFYRAFLSPLLPPSCRFYPSCSA